MGAAQYGAHKWGDGSVVFSSPAVANAFPRWWMPEQSGLNPWHGAKPYMGDFKDGFKNKVTILGISNPVVGHPSRVGIPKAYAERSPGYGLIRFFPNNET